MRRTLPLLVALAIAAIGLSLTGCATSSNGQRPRDTVILGGLFAHEPGAFDQQTPVGIPLNTDEPSRSKRMSGDKVSFLWGLFTFRDQ